jgi:hypothetical protein
MDYCVSCKICGGPFSIAVQKSSGRHHICISFLTFCHEVAQWQCIQSHSRLRDNSLACQSIELNVCGDQVSFVIRNARRSPSCIWDVSWAFVSLVILLPFIDSDTPVMSQWAQLGIDAIGPLACDRTTSDCNSTLMFSLSSRNNGRFMSYACHLSQWKLNVILSHHRKIWSWIVMIRSQSILYYVSYCQILVIWWLSLSMMIDDRIGIIHIVYVWYLNGIMCQ